jgi:hypothetical protein
VVVGVGLGYPVPQARLADRHCLVSAATGGSSRRANSTARRRNSGG